MVQRRVIAAHVVSDSLTTDFPSAQSGGDFLHWVGDWHIGQGWWRVE